MNREYKKRAAAHFAGDIVNQKRAFRLGRIASDA
jgi:hypothetical protein